jgi:hypothetical protein
MGCGGDRKVTPVHVFDSRDGLKTLVLTQGIFVDTFPTLSAIAVL